MSIEQGLLDRAGSQCELCGSANNVSAMLVPPQTQLTVDNGIVVCDTCKSQIESGEMDANHWRCLNDSMWSQVPAVQVVAYRMLKRLSAEPWAQDLLDVMYMEDDTRKWAESGAADDDRIGGMQPLNSGRVVRRAKLFQHPRCTSGRLSLHA